MKQLLLAAWLAFTTIAGPASAIPHGQAYSYVPPLAATWGLTKRTYHQPCTSLASIDTTNSGAAGFPLYVRTAWPNTTYGGTWATGAPTASSFISVGAGGCLISGFNSGGSGAAQFSLATAISDGASGYIGFAPKAPYYVEFQWTINYGCANHGASVWPIVWFQGLGILQGTLSVSVENDIEENFPSANFTPTNDANLHQWTCTGIGVCGDGGTSISINWPVSTPTGPQIYGTAVIDTVTGSGTGYMQYAYNNITQPAMQQTFGTTGNYSNLNTDGMVILINGGQDNCAVTLGYLDVWQQP
jgi:hypothetical protein